jgi:branched-chain amino acid aminotransferase
LILLAFRTTKDRIVIFRPKDNGARFNRGANGFCMPEVPEDVFLDGVASVVRANSHWVPPEGK